MKAATRKAWERALTLASCGRGAFTDVCPMRENNYELERALCHSVFGRDFYEWQTSHEVAASLALDGIDHRELP